MAEDDDFEENEDEEENEPESSPELAFSESLDSDKYKVRENVIHFWNGQFWEVPSSLDKTALRWLAANKPKLVSARKAKSLLDTASKLLEELPDPDPTIIPVQNGYLRLSPGGTVSLEPFNPEGGITYAVNAKYDQSAKAPTFENFLSTVLPDPEVRGLVQEYVGYTFLPDTRYQKCQAWIGKGRNGKGTLANIIGSLHQKVTSIDISYLKGFGLSGLIDASLVRVDELPKRIDEGFFKTLISGDPILIDIKHKSPVSMRVRAKWILCGNDLFQIRDQSDGVWRRLQVIPFTIQIPQEQVNPFLEKEIVGTELSGVLNWALAGLQRLLKRKKFPEPEAVAAAIVDARFERDSIYAWVRENEPKVLESPETLKDTVYQHYLDWAASRGFKIENTIAFWKNLRNYVSPISDQKRRSNGALKYFVNIAI